MNQMILSIEHFSPFQGIGVAAAVALAVLAIGARLSAWRGRNHLFQMVEDRKPNARELIVIVHGYAKGPRVMEGVKNAIREVKPEADLALCDYNRYRFSNGNPFRIAERIDEILEDWQSERQYTRIVLVGYSMGALLVRKAYVYGCGSVADAPTAGGDRAATRPPREWVKQVRRVVLLAGMNRGWDPQGKTGNRSFSEALLVRSAIAFVKATGTAKLLLQGAKGSPFVANLRLQWLEVMRNAEALGITPPKVIQLLGDRDTVVDKEDSRDVAVARDFVWVVVNNTSHGNMVDLGDSGTKLERKRKIQLAFGDEDAIERFKRTNPLITLAEDRDVRNVVFVLHGIRDMGDWTSMFETPLQNAYLREFPGGGKLHVHPASYGYFGMLPFLLWADRQKNVRWFMDEVTELTARFPNLEEIHFIGHSNGTYVLASALARYASLKVGRVVLAGSVVRRDYQWSDFTGRVGSVRNYVGSKDLIVGLLPRVFELPGFRHINRDLGSAGFNGFEDGFVKSMQTEYVRGGHAAALVEENVPSIVDFIINGRRTDIPSLDDQRPGWMNLASNVCWILWIFAVALILCGGMGVWMFGVWVAPKFGWNPAVSAVPLCSVCIYLGFLWLLLTTI